MRKVKYSIILMIIMLFISTKVWATGDIVISGPESIKSGESNTVTVSVSAQDTIGLITGKIEYSSNIESITVTGKNNWNLTYNSSTGEFNTYKAEGSKTEEIIEINYKIKENQEGTATITLTNLKETTIDYTTKDIDNVSKSITISKANIDENNGEDNNDKDNTNQDNDSNQEENDKENIGENNDKENKEDNDKEEETEKDQNKGQSTQANTKLPNTGKEDVFIVCMIGAVLILGITAYKQSKKYKGI